MLSSTSIVVMPFHGQAFRAGRDAVVLVDRLRARDRVPVDARAAPAPRWRRALAVAAAIATVSLGNITRIAASVIVGLFAGRSSLVLFHDWVGGIMTYVYTLGGFIVFLVHPPARSPARAAAGGRDQRSRRYSVRTDTIIVTGVGGPAGVAVVRDLRARGHHVVGVDCDPLAAGLHLASDRALLPRFDDPDYLDELCRLAEKHGPCLLVSTLAEEMPGIARRVRRARGGRVPHVGAARRRRARVHRQVAVRGGARARTGSRRPPPRSAAAGAFRARGS